MAIIKCKKCLKEVPSETSSCPHCGSKVETLPKIETYPAGYLKRWFKIPHDKNDWPDKKIAPWNIVGDMLKSSYDRIRIKHTYMGDFQQWVKFFAGDNAYYSTHYVLKRDEGEGGKWIFFGIRIEKPSRESMAWCKKKGKSARFNEWKGALGFLTEKEGSEEWIKLNNALKSEELVCEQIEDEDYFEIEALADLKDLIFETGPDAGLDVYIGKNFFEKDLVSATPKDVFDSISEVIRLIKPLHDFILAKQK